MHPVMLLLSLAAAAPNPAPEQSLHRFLQEEFRQEREDRIKFGGQDPEIRYSAALTDLNDDGFKEALVHVTGNGMCGTGGCFLYVLTREGRGWRKVTAIPETRAPIRLLGTRSHGWHDISVYVAGGGIIPGYDAQLKFDGRTYPTNPTVPPARHLKGTASSRVLIGRNAKQLSLYQPLRVR